LIVLGSNVLILSSIRGEIIFGRIRENESSIVNIAFFCKRY